MFTLRPYQQEAVNASISYFKKKNDPAVIVLPTGAGKSLVIAELSKIAKGRVLILAHVKELVEQNYNKYINYDLEAGIYSAGLNKKESNQKVIFGSIQSVARASDTFFENFSLLIIDECHRVTTDDETQYKTVIEKLKKYNSTICILGLTATPYRIGIGWIYQYNYKGEIKTKESRFFHQCIYELPLSYMIKNNYLTKPIKIDIPVTCYDFSEVTEKGRMYTTSEIEELLKKQKRLTPLIIKNIIDITENYNRQGVMIFSSTIKHAQEILSYLPKDDSNIIIGDTEQKDRDKIINDFKRKQFKYLVNVSVLTTGFDAPHIDVIALLRPTESVSLYQQIIGRGLRLDESKKDCFILDYTGIGHDLYSPEISEKKPTSDSEIVLVNCPLCSFENTFWGKLNLDHEVVEHFGRKCKGAIQNPETLEYNPCGYRFRFKNCHTCGAENDISAKQCNKCKAVLVDADNKLKQAKLSKNSHVLIPDSVQFSEQFDRNGNSYLEVRYFDYDAKSISEVHYLNNYTGLKKFNINFLRSHLKRPEFDIEFSNPQEVVQYQAIMRIPSFIIARKQDKFWKITEKIFIEELGLKNHL